MGGPVRNRPFLAWALDPATPWSGNFREFNACVTRLATLADGGRVTKADVEAEIARSGAGAPRERRTPGRSRVVRTL